MKPSEEQIKRFWKYFGFTNLTSHGYGKDDIFWTGLNGKEQITFLKLDLNNLFLYAVPKFWVCDLAIEEAIFAVAKVGQPDLGEASHLVEIKDGRPDIAFALALFWAIMEVVSNDNR